MNSKSPDWKPVINVITVIITGSAMLYVPRCRGAVEMGHHPDYLIPVPLLAALGIVPSLPALDLHDPGVLSSAALGLSLLLCKRTACPV
jgi:hypothetical protein